MGDAAERASPARYLCALWVGEGWRGGGQRQTFVDLGCGNGFLTHLLTEEGHVGKGYDRQRRKIWDIYGGETTPRLVIGDVDPATAVYPDVDWVIGNHSDELTPFLPGIANRCGPKTVRPSEFLLSMNDDHPRAARVGLISSSTGHWQR